MTGGPPGAGWGGRESSQAWASGQTEPPRCRGRQVRGKADAGDARDGICAAMGRDVPNRSRPGGRGSWALAKPSWHGRPRLPPWTPDPDARPRPGPMGEYAYRLLHDTLLRAGRPRSRPASRTAEPTLGSAPPALDAPLPVAGRLRVKGGSLPMRFTAPDRPTSRARSYPALSRLRPFGAVRLSTGNSHTCALDSRDDHLSRADSAPPKITVALRSLNAYDFTASFRKKDSFAAWCNGSTTVSGTVCQGSNPCAATIRCDSK